MKKYELVYIVHPDLESTIGKVTEKIDGFIKNKNGVIINEENWGKRKLSYPIQKNDFGIYVLLVFEAEEKDLKDIEKRIRLSEEVIRYLLTVFEKEIIRKAEIKKDKDTEKEKKKEKKQVVLEAEGESKSVVVEEKKEEEPEKNEKERMQTLDKKLEELLGGDE